MYSKFQLLVDSEKIRFLVVGFYNTLVGYLIFLLVHYFFRLHLNSFWILFLANIFSITHSFYTLKYIVFKKKGNKLKQYSKTCLVYGVTFVFNYLLLLIFVDKLFIDIRISQAIIVCGLALLSFVGHKYFSFANE